MKHIINKKTLAFFLTISFFSFSACTKNDIEIDEHNHSAETESAHEENIVTLTRQQINTVGIEIGFIEQKQLSGTLKTNGELRISNSNRANATSMFGGVIKSLNIEIGEVVKKGQVIATISNPQFIQLQEEFLSINSQIEFANQEVTRQKTLHEGNAGALKNLQSATAELNRLTTRKASLKKQIEMMGINPTSLTNSNLKSSLVVTSPISGTISNVYATIGNYVDVSSPIVEIIENNALHLDLQVYEKDISLIEIGQKVNFIITNNPNKNYTAEIYNMNSSFSGESKTISVHSKIIGDKTGLIEGMNVTGMISLDNVLTTAVPNDAIVNFEGKYFIFLVNETENSKHNKDKLQDENEVEFTRMEVFTGATQLGYTAITPVQEIALDRHIVTKGAFFVNAKLDDSAEHAH